MLQLFYIWEIECEENVHTPESDKRQKANDVFLDPEGFLRFKDSSFYVSVTLHMVQIVQLDFASKKPCTWALDKSFWKSNFPYNWLRRNVNEIDT